MLHAAAENDAPIEREALNRRPVLLAVAVATAGVLPAFLTGGLAVQMRGELGFGAATLGLAVAAFFAFSSLASVVIGRLVERIGAHRGMRLAAVGSAAPRRRPGSPRPAPRVGPRSARSPSALRSRPLPTTGPGSSPAP